ncbi:MAG: response regulator [Candidatus Omnitrophica bacterium]|nr:response regulator [Candidatus Omnitrophota bacterium]
MAISKILICDDEENICESLKLILGDHYNLIAVDCGDMALEVLSHSQEIKVMLLDIALDSRFRGNDKLLMNDKSGIDVLQKIKKDFPHVKIILIGGHKSTNTATEATRLGANGHISKPLKAEEILETVKKNMD